MVQWGGEIASATKVVAITPHDSTNFTDGPCHYIYVGGAGNIALVPMGGGSPVTFTAVPVGTVLPVRALRINATGTTATAMVALYTRT